MLPFLLAIAADGGLASLSPFYFHLAHQLLSPGGGDVNCPTAECTAEHDSRRRWPKTVADDAHKTPQRRRIPPGVGQGGPARALPSSAINGGKVVVKVVAQQPWLPERHVRCSRVLLEYHIPRAQSDEMQEAIGSLGSVPRRVLVVRMQLSARTQH
jgi:hypothetical protein